MSQGQSPGSRARRTRKPFTAAAGLLEYHPLTSMDRKLKLNSRGRGPRAQRPQKRGWGGDHRLLLFPLQQQKPLRQMGGGKTPGLSCNPYPKPPPPGRHPCPGLYLPPQQPPPPARLGSPCSPVNPIPTQFFIAPSNPGPGKPPTRQGQTSQLWAGPRSACRSPHAKLITIGSLHSAAPTPNPTRRHPTAPRAREGRCGCGWEEQKGKETNLNYPNRNPRPRREVSGRGRGRVAGSRVGSAPAGARGGDAPAPAARLHSPQRCRTGSPQPSSATGPPAAPAASSPPARRLHRLLPPRPPRGRPRSVAARAPRQQRRLPGRGLGADTDPRTPRARLETSARRARASRRCRAPGLAPFFLSSFRRRDYSSAPPPPAGSRARSQQNSGRRALPHFRSQHGA